MVSLRIILFPAKELETTMNSMSLQRFSWTLEKMSLSKSIPTHESVDESNIIFKKPIVHEGVQYDSKQKSMAVLVSDLETCWRLISMMAS